MQFLGINVGKFTEEPKEANSIAKFFQKSSSKESVPTTNQSLYHKDIPPAATSKKPVTVQSSSTSSFFLRCAEKEALAKSPAKKESDPVKNKDEQPVAPQKQEVPNFDGTDTVPTNQAMAMAVSEDLNSNDYSFTSQDASAEAPCPQCGSLVSILGMSEHLDHHIATELHKELNQIAPTVPSSQAPSSSTGGVTGKRKYTKNPQSQSDAKKTRSIKSFFTQK